MQMVEAPPLEPKYTTRDLAALGSFWFAQLAIRAGHPPGSAMPVQMWRIQALPTRLAEKSQTLHRVHVLSGTAAFISYEHLCLSQYLELAANTMMFLNRGVTLRVAQCVQPGLHGEMRWSESCVPAFIDEASFFRPN